MNLARVLARARAQYPDAPEELLDYVEARALFVMVLRGHHHSMRELGQAEAELAKLSPDASRIVRVSCANAARYFSDVANAWIELLRDVGATLHATRERYLRAKYKHEQLYEDRPFYEPKGITKP